MTVELIPQTRDSDCNAYLIKQSGVTVLIDAPEQAAKRIIDGGEKLTAIILTHGHFDHISGLKAIAEATGASVYIHGAEIPMLTDTAINLADMFYEKGTFPLYTGKVKPLHDGDNLLFASKPDCDSDEEQEDLTFRIFHAPGHTPGLIAVQTGNKIFTGDFIFEGSIGNTSFINSKPEDMEASLKRFVSAFGDKDYTLYPGHGGETSLARERKYNLFLQ
jgi:glyoxylase-like metal-dependent hydrolase (beta-lactamase superfamily II)